VRWQKGNSRGTRIWHGKGKGHLLQNARRTREKTENLCRQLSMSWPHFKSRGRYKQKRKPFDPAKDQEGHGYRETGNENGL